jgi:drug/metabolite transporter (DMT)-like permease
MSLEAVFGMLGGMIFFGDLPSLQEAVGCAILFISVLYTQLVATFEDMRGAKKEDVA